MAVYSWNFRILQTINEYKRALNNESSYEISLKLDEKCSRGIRAVPEIKLWGVDGKKFFLVGGGTFHN